MTHALLSSVDNSRIQYIINFVNCNENCDCYIHEMMHKLLSSVDSVIQYRSNLTTLKLKSDCYIHGMTHELLSSVDSRL